MNKQYLLLREKFSYTKEKFIEKARKIHGDKYDYSKVEYINAKTKVCIVCPIHGEFWQTPDKHLRGQGCRECSNRVKLTNGNFIKRSKEIFGEDSFDYSNVSCKTVKDNVSLVCKKCGKTFNVTPHNHLHHKEGCPFCKLSKLERDVENVLTKNGIQYEQQKIFDWLVDGKKIKRLDFYLPNHNIVIECQGLQHFKPIEYFGGKEHFELQQFNDEIKRKLCEEHGFEVLYYSNKKINSNYKLYTNLKDLIQKIEINKC